MPSSVSVLLSPSVWKKKSERASIAAFAPSISESGCRGDRLCAVYGRAAADGEQNVDLVFFADLRAAVDGRVPRIGFYARKLKAFRPRAGNFFQNFLIKSDSLDRAATVDEKDSLSVLFELFPEIFQLVFSEINLSGVLKNKIVHFTVPFLILLSHYTIFNE